MDLKEINILGNKINNHWYYESKAQAMMKFFINNSPTTILDIGAGSGFFSRYLLSKSPAAQEAFCVDISYPHSWVELESNKPVHYIKEINSSLPSADCMLMMDVLEHVDDDIELLKSYSQKLLDGSHVFISVPAFPWLWSNHDIFLEHKRRYTLESLEKTVIGAGLQVKSICYYFGLIFPAAASLRLFSKVVGKSKIPHSQLQNHNRLLNNILKSLCLMETSFMKVNKLCGLSVLCLAIKH